MKCTPQQSARSHSKILSSTIVLAALLALAGTPAARAANKYWIAGNGSWNNAANWTPSGVPNFHDNIYIGNMPGVQNSTVTINNNIVVIFDYLQITDGMTVDLNGSELVGIADADITGAGTHLIARPSFAANQLDFWGNTYIGPGAHVELVDNVPIELGYDRSNQGLISGRGSVRMGGDYSNDGVIKPGGNGGLLLYAGPGATGFEMDLDGTSGNGHLQLNTPFSQLRVEFGSLADSFSGTLTMTRGALLTMDIDDGWTADAGAVFNILGTNNPAAASQINGSDMSFGGVLSVGVNQAHLRVLADTTLLPSAVVNLAAGGWLEFDGETTVAGGQYTLGLGAKLDFDEDTTVQGGTFTTPSTNPVDGLVSFNDTTFWSGTITFNGVARQTGNTSYTAGTTVINAPNSVFDMDGPAGYVLWAVDHSLTVNAGQIDTEPGAPNQFEGLMNITGGIVPRLTLNLTDPAASWIMNGTMQLWGLTNLYETRVAGSPMVVNGTVNLMSGRVNITADTTFSAFPAEAHVNFVPDSVLRMMGDTYVGGATDFAGHGTLQNGPTGAMTLDHGVQLDDVDLVNQGHLFIRRANAPDLAGLVSVDRFTNLSNATWHMRIGGYTLGHGHDHIVVTTGSATLNGNLQITLFNAGGVPFSPQVGDEFTILTAVGGVAGNVVVSPTACINGNSYHWSVLYGPSNVRVRLDSIDIMPGDMNCDCAVNGLDIQPFVFALLDPATHASAYPGCDIMHGDINSDGTVDLADFEPFVQLLVGTP